MQTSTPNLLLATDRQHSPLAVQAGASRQQLAQGPYGSRPSAATRAGYTGQLREVQDWYLLGNGHRLYNPALMRFHSADRFSPFDRGGLNAYAYCAGDPVNHRDPSGRFILDEGLTPVFSLFLHSGLLLNVGTVMAFKSQSLVQQLLNGAAMVGSALNIVGGSASLAGQDALQPVVQLGLLISGTVAFARFGTNIKDVRMDRRMLKQAKEVDASATATPSMGTPMPGHRGSSVGGVSLGSLPPRLGSLSDRGSVGNLSSIRKGSLNSVNLQRRDSRQSNYGDTLL